MKKYLVLSLCLLVSASAFAKLQLPDPPPGTFPLYVPDPVLPSNAKDAPGFACYGACGPSCDCVGKEVGKTLVTCSAGERCEWPTTTCKTHSFCRWHDSCYLSCDNQYPGKVNDGNRMRTSCYRVCDFACIDGEEPTPYGGWKTKSPGKPPEALGISECLRRLSMSEDVAYDGKMDFVDTPTCVPDPKCG